MKKFITIFILFFTLNVLAKIPIDKIEYSPFQLYNPSYWLFGSNDAKVQVSLKYHIIHPKSWGSLYFAYTEILLWDIYNSSSPFRDSNRKPEPIVYESPAINFIDYIKVAPYAHHSNGRDGDENRSIEKSFIETQFSIGKKYNLGWRIRYFHIWATATQNKDIDLYIGNWVNTLFFKIKGGGNWTDKEEIYIKGEAGNHQWVIGESLRNVNRYWLEAGLSFRILTKNIQPCFYLQYWRGYGETILEYNKWSENFRFGIIFKV